MKSKKIIAIILMLMSLNMVSGCQGKTPSTTSEQKNTSSGKYSLEFDAKKYTSKTLTVDNKTIKYRAYEKIVYVKNPVDINYEIMNIYIPEEYFEAKSIGNYTADTAPIFLPNTVGGYMPGPPGTLDNSGPSGHGAAPNGAANGGQGGAPNGATGGAPGVGANGGAPNGGASAASVALSKGYIVAEPGARGRSTQDEKGQYTGKAPAAIVDLKAAVRYLRYNDKVMPGNAEKIISNGTSAGGALSALLGATGNNADYEPYLKALGAADAKDDIFASSDYCPITNLNNADMAYEWQFNGINDYKGMQGSSTLTANQIKLSNDLKKLFPAYVNSLGLKSTDGTTLTLDANGDGTFKNYVKSFVIASAQKALSSGTNLSGLTWITIKDGKVTDIDFDKYNQYVGRMKSAPAFDGVDLSTPENEELGTATIKAQHFTQFSKDNSTASNSSIADSTIIKMMNPMNYIGTQGTTTAHYFRIRYGSVDNNTSTAIPLILATKLQNSGYDADFAVPWGIGHAGDYDLDDLFTWADKICQGK